MLLPGVQLAAAVDGALQLVIAAGAEEVVGEIVLALPLQLDRRPHLLGDGGRFHHVVIHQPPAKAAAAARLVDDDIVFRQAHHLGHHGLAAVRLLGRNPHFQDAVMPVGRGVHRLQRRVRDESVIVIGFHHVRRLGEGGIDIADIGVGLGREGPGDFLGLGIGGRQGILGGLALVPGHLQRILGLEGVPGAVGDDGDARHHLDRKTRAFQREDIDHAGHFADIGFVEARHLAADRRALGVGGIDHAGHLYVDAEQRLAGDHFVVVDAGVALAQKAVFAGLLQLERGRLRHRHLGRGRRELAIGPGLAAGLVGQHGILGHDLAGGHVPFLGGGGDQHCLGAGAGLAQLIPGPRDGRGAARALIAIEFGIDLGLVDLDRLPVGIQLLGDDQAECGLDTLADFRALGIDDHPVFRRDADKGVDQPGIALGGLGPARWQREGQHKPRAGSGAELQESAPAQFEGGVGGQAFDVIDQLGGIGIRGREIQLCVRVHRVPSPIRRIQGWRNGCGHSSRSGRCCRSWRRECRRRWAWACP